MTAPLTGSLPATNELVAVAWLSQRVAGLDASMVATQLPQDIDSWREKGFVQVQAIPGGSAMIDVPQIRRPILQVDAWATNSTSAKSSTKVPWGRANSLIELIRIATEDAAQVGFYGAPLALPSQFGPVRVQAVYFAYTEPTRVLGDPNGFARYTLDLAIDWVRQ
jgi:hypothetical protein